MRSGAYDVFLGICGLSLCVASLFIANAGVRWLASRQTRGSLSIYIYITVHLAKRAAFSGAPSSNTYHRTCIHGSCHQTGHNTIAKSVQLEALFLETCTKSCVPARLVCWTHRTPLQARERLQYNSLHLYCMPRIMY